MPDAKLKIVTPYQQLLKNITEFCDKLATRHRRTMWTYPKDDIDNGSLWELDHLRERVIAADQLGYEVMISEVDGYLRVEYVKELPTIPWEWR